MDAITVKNLTKRFGRKTAVDRLSFTVRAGTITGFLGPNGAGKTTTIRILLGLAAPDAGSAVICGQPYRQLAAPSATVGALLEDAGYHPGRSARAHLRACAAAAGIPPRRADEVLGQTGLAEAAGQRAGGYSAGMRRRLGLATALLGKPEILILDEPANGLDPPGVRWLRGLLRHVAASGGTVLLSSHMLDETARIADDIVLINHGRLVAAAPLHTLTRPAPGTAAQPGQSLEDVFFQFTEENQR